jgi:hypothetical protein
MTIPTATTRSSTFNTVAANQTQSHAITYTASCCTTIPITGDGFLKPCPRHLPVEKPSGRKYALRSLGTQNFW